MRHKIYVKNESENHQARHELTGGKKHEMKNAIYDMTTAI